MFFEFSLAKDIPVMTVALLLGFGAFFGLALVNKFSGQERAFSEFVARQQAQALYFTLYQIPQAGRLGLAAIGLLPQPSVAADDARAAAASIPVLVYHGESGNTPVMPASIFINHMHTLHASGWRTVTIEEFADFMKGRRTLPERSFLLTFDDGRRDSFYSTDPLLEDLGYTAVMFTVSGYSFPEGSDTPINRYYLSKSELDYMAKSGRWQLESHGDQAHRLYTVPGSSSTTASALFVSGEHFLSNKFWVPDENRIETTGEYNARVTHDLSLSKRLLEDTFGRRVTTFAFPFSDYGNESVNFPGVREELARIVRSLYEFAFYQWAPGDGDSFNYKDPNDFMVKRITPQDDWDGKELLAVLEGGRAKQLPYEANDFTYGWYSNWGAVSGSESALELRSAPDTSGGSAFLDGTGAWKNYRFRATAEVTLGTLSLIARYTDTTNPYLVCAFSRDRIYLERHRGSTQTTLASAPFSPPPLPATYDVSMTVEGPNVGCEAYGTRVQSSSPGISPVGGIGASIWHPKVGAARAAVQEARVLPL